MHRRLLACLLAALCGGAGAQTQAPASTNEQVVVPEIDRRDVKKPRLPSNDFEFGLYTGTYSVQNFGSHVVAGLRLGYHLTEDVFVEGAYGRTKVSDEMIRQILPGGVFANPSERLSYYNLSAGYNVMPGEVFFGRNLAKVTAFYLIGGIGSTSFVDQKKQTFNLGFGTRLLFNDHVAVQADVRDHIFSVDLLGKKQTTQNPEITFGLTVYF